jgi:hypothetical protein
MQGHDGVLAMAAGQANISHDADQAASRDQDSKNMLPHFVELIVKSVIIFDESKLAFVAGVLFKRPIGRRSKDQVDRPRRNPVHFPGISAT